MPQATTSVNLHKTHFSPGNVFYSPDSDSDSGNNYCLEWFYLLTFITLGCINLKDLFGEFMRQLYPIFGI